MILKASKSTLNGTVAIPGSKSHTIRAVAIASLASGCDHMEHVRTQLPYALVAGANQGGRDRPALRFAVSDAARFASVLQELGGEVKEARSGKIHVLLNGNSANFSHAKHSLPKEEVVQVRKFIETCGIDPERDYPI